MSTTEQHHTGAPDDETSTAEYETRIQRLPAIRDALLALNVQSVAAHYELGSIELSLSGTHGQRIAVYLDLSLELCAIFEVIASRRYAGQKHGRFVGSFDWDLVKDFLEHRHVLTVVGL